MTPATQDVRGLDAVVRSSHSRGGRKLRLCIVTPDIAGPIRNGGVGTAYRHLAELLARDGHEVTVLFTLGRYCESGTFSDWVDRYGTVGIRLIPSPECPVPSVDGLVGAVTHRARQTYEALVGLDQFDLVHSPDWGGDVFFALMAKRLGLDFQETTFCVTAHGPHLWGLEGNRQHVTSKESVARIYMEKTCVEHADIVISPTRHMLEWMAGKNYSLPRDRTFLQPNVFPIDVSTIGPQTSAGQLEPVQEVVFLGRLEPRKGIHVFLAAMDILFDEGILGDVSVTFLGKPCDLFPESEIRLRAARWRVAFDIRTDLDSGQALAYLREGGRLAVLPSLLDNAPYTVVECLALRIPFVAANTGGIPELIAYDDVEHATVPANPANLAHKLKQALQFGYRPTRCAFDFSANVETWRDFHDSLANGELPFPAPPPPYPLFRADDEHPAVSVCIAHHERPKKLARLIEALDRQTFQDFEVVIVDDGSRSPESRDYLDELGPPLDARGWQLIRQENMGPDGARNVAARRARGRFLLFMDDDNVPKPDEIEVFVRAAEFSGADALTCFADAFDTEDLPNDKDCLYRIPFLGGGVSLGLLINSFGDTNSLVRRKAFEEAGGFTEEGGAGCEDHELFARLTLRGHRVMTVPRVLYWYQAGRDRRSLENLENVEGELRVLREYLRHTPVELHDLLRYALGRARKETSLGDIDAMENSYTWKMANGTRLALLKVPGVQWLLSRTRSRLLDRARR